MALDDPASEIRPIIPQDIANAIADPAVHASERIHEVFAWLRANEPLGIARPEGFGSFWVVSRQQDLRTITMRPDLFTNGDRLVLIDGASERRMMELLDGRAFPIRTILHMDPPEHTAYRNITAEAFHARTLDALAESIREIARGFVDRLLETGGACDFTETVAFLYPLRVVMDMLGVAPDDEPEVLRLSHAFLSPTDDEYSQLEGNQTAGDALAAVAGEFNAFFDRLLGDRRAAPRRDILSAIANAEIDGAPIPLLEARSYCAHLATAGHETTSSVTSGAMLALCRDPALFAAVKADRSLIPALIEEATRFYTPSKILMRTVAEDTRMCGRSFRRGDWVALAFASGSRDEEAVPDAETFRIDRKPNKLISYGYGPHVCLGQHLARLEMRLLFAELLDRLDAVELAGEPKITTSLIVSGIKSLPIRFRTG